MTVRPLNIALDFDGTFTEDKDLWLDFVDLTKRNRPHRIYMVTLRSEEHDRDAIHDYLEDYGVEIVWCDGRSKREVVDEKGIHIDIWIDDMPESIGRGSHLTPEQLEEWRRTRER